MHVLYFHQHFSTPSGSVGIRSYEMARKLISEGHRVTMVCGSYGGGSTGIDTGFSRGVRTGVSAEINVIEFDLGYSNSDGFFKRVVTFLKFAYRSTRVAMTLDYDVVFATSTPLTAGIPGIFAKWFRKKRFVFEVRDLWPELPKAMGVIKNPLILAALSFLEWCSYRSADRLIGLSPGIVEGIRKRGVAAELIESVPNGCDLQIFDEKVSPWRPAGIAPDDLLAVFAGTHGTANGLDAVLDAAVELKSRGRNDIKILLIGQGKHKSGLQRRAKEAQLTNVIFHDPVNKAHLAGLMASADLGLQVLANVPAFYYGTSPNKFFDYIAAGLPVLNNYPGWLAEMIVSHRCGFAVAPDSAAKFADALEFAAGNRVLLKEMGRNGRVLAAERFSRAELSSRWVDWVTKF